MKSRIALPALATLVVALALCTSAQAQWKWRDKSGQLHISDLPPPAEVADKDVLQRPNQARAAAAAAAPASAASAAADKARVDPELEARTRRAEQEKQQAQKQADEREQAAKAENCARAKEQLRTLDSGMRIARMNDKGEREIMDDRTRATESQRARNAIASDCR
jgi:hypothetical protein